MGRFLDVICPNEPMRGSGEYAICDPRNRMPAHSCEPENSSDQVLVKASMQTRFCPVDHCLGVTWFIQRDRRRCDGIIISDDYKTLAFVEIKQGRHGWRQEAMEQLQSTIEMFNNEERPVFEAAIVRRAYVANRNASYQACVFRGSESNDFFQSTRCRIVVAKDIEL